jgi:hypothetical protein
LARSVYPPPTSKLLLGPPFAAHKEGKNYFLT